MCIERGFGYLDRAGNCHLAFGGVYVHVEGRPNPSPREPSLRTLFSPRAERVLRVLLTHSQRRWRTVPLASEAGVSVGQIDKVKKALQAQDHLEDGPEGFRAARPGALLDLWARDYATRSAVRFGKPYAFYAMEPAAEIERRIGELYEENAGECAVALSGLSAAARLAPYARAGRVTVTLKAGLGDLPDRLGLTPVDSGANVTLTEAYDAGIFYGARCVDGVPVLGPVQTYLDLWRAGGRARAGAEHLRAEVLEREWQRQTPS
jgi:hypothetical protein